MVQSLKQILTSKSTAIGILIPMNAHCERFNRTLQDELIDYNLYDLENTDEFNEKVSDYLFWYNAKRPHYALG